MVGGGVVIMLAMQGFGDGVGVARFRKLVSLMGDEILRDESLDDDELTWMVLLKQHGLTLILAVILPKSCNDKINHLIRIIKT